LKQARIKKRHPLIYVPRAKRLTDLGETAMDKLQPLIDELGKLGTITSKYADFVECRWIWKAFFSSAGLKSK
jgi:hypothetical protein